VTQAAHVGTANARRAATEVPSGIDEAFRALSRAFRAWQLYLPNNPTRDRALEVARQALTAVLRDHDEGFTVTVREHEFAHAGQVIYRDVERPTDGMPWLLYRDGLRELTLLPGFPEAGLAELLSLMQRARQAAPDEDDLITMLWVADIETLRYRFVELGGPVETSVLAGTADDVGVAGDRPGSDIPTAESAMPTGEPPGLVRVEEFDSALFFLDARELAYLQEEMRTEFGSDARVRVMASLFDIVEVETDEATRLEVIARLEDLLLDLLTTSAYEQAAEMLREARTTIGRAPELTEPVRAALAGLAAQLSEPAVLSQLLQAIDEGPRAPSADTLEALVAELRGAALGPLLSWLATAPAGLARTAVERAAQKLAERHTADLVRHIESDDGAVAQSAIRLAALLRSTAAVPALGKLVRQGGATVRHEAAQALGAIGTAGALQALEPLVEDADRDVRLTALRAIGTARHAAALPRLARLLQRKELRQADRSEKTAVFDAFGAICGADGVALLDGLLNARSLLGPRESTEMRACAARALGLVGTEPALQALRRSVDTKDAVVRNEVARALRGGGA
jgi:HEAT repeat protein